MFLQDGQSPLGGFREVLESLHSALIVFDRQDRVAFANRAAVSLLAARGTSEPIASLADLFRALGPLQNVDGTTLDESHSPAVRLARDESFCCLRLRAAERWGTRRPVLSFSGQAVGEGESDLGLRVLTIEDDSHRYEREALFRTAFEEGPVPVSLIRASDARVIDVNPAFLELLGYGRAEVVGHTVPELAELLGNENLRNAKEKFDEVERLEVAVRGRNDLNLSLLTWQRWVEVGFEECLLGVYVDVTEQKEMERKLREATEVVLESASVFSMSVVKQLERLRGPDRPAAVSGDFDMLTRREREVVTRVGAGHSNLKIAAELALTPQTVRNYVTRIYRKIGVTNRAEAVVWARERGLVMG